MRPDWKIINHSPQTPTKKNNLLPFTQKKGGTAAQIIVVIVYTSRFKC